MERGTSVSFSSVTWDKKGIQNKKCAYFEGFQISDSLGY